jgi:fatty-acyl-CoA synthase
VKLVKSVLDASRRVWLEARAVAALIRAGMFGLEPPRRLAAIVGAIRDFGAFGGLPTTAALRHGDLPAIADERGEITFKELEEQVNRLVDALRARGLGPGSTIGILCRNHRGPMLVAFASSRLGASAIWLNTSFSPRQAQEVGEREGVELLVYDAELAELAAELAPVHGRVVTATDDPAADELDRLIAAGEAVRPPPDRAADERHHGHAEGRAARRSPLADDPRRAARADADACA